MSSSHSVERPVSIAAGARAATDAERASMMKIVARLDAAMGAKDAAAIGQLFAPDAVCELKPAGLRIKSLDTVIEMFRRSLPALSASFSAREQSQIWTNQNGVVREWLYPVRLSTGEELRARLLEVIEFTGGLGAVASYRLRMNLLYSNLFERALGEDFASLPGVKRVPR